MSLAAHALIEEAILTGDCRCEYGHYGVLPCTVAVTHRIAGCTPGEFNVCEAARTVIQARLTEDQCVDCNRPAAMCWTIRPV